MISALGILASGLDVQRTRLNVSANNVANVATPGFEPSTVAAEAQAGGGVTARVETPPSVSRGALFSGTDLVTEAVTQMSALQAYKAQIAAMKTQDEMLHTLTHTA